MDFRFKLACARSIAMIFMLLAGTLPAAEQSIKPAVPPSLEGVTWAGPGVALSDLRGKSVVILVYATNYQVATDWPTQFLAQLKLASQNKPVVILAINADKKADLDLTYMNAREFNGPNILHGRDPLLPARLGMKSEFFKYLLIDPTGKVVGSGDAGEHFTNGEERRYALAWKITKSEDLGEFEIIDEQMPTKIKQMLWPYELGRLPAETDLKKARMKLDEEEQKLVDKAFDRYLDAEVKKICKGVEGTIEEQLLAFERAKCLHGAFRTKAQAEQIKEAGLRLYQDQEFKKELAAKQAYDKALHQCATAKNASTIRPRLMQGLAKQYKDTLYGEMAANDGKAVRPKSIHAWKDFTEAEIQTAASKQKKFIEEVSLKIPCAGMKSYETKRFLFYSDIPPQIINGMYLPYLDAMYKQLCAAYGIDSVKNIWRGKAIIVAFANESSFQQFEMIFYQNSKPGAQGVAHCDTNKNVVISCYAGKDPKYFAVVLVHETAHGFSWCYKSAESLPNWLNEGASEWIAHRVVTGDTSIERKIQAAMVTLRNSRSMGGDFYTLEHIHAWQYGLAASITNYLLNYEPSGRPSTSSAKTRGKVSRYRKLIDGIKDGLPWEDALRETYHLTPLQLAHAYGQSIGIPDLQP
ncbi:MAG: hypothetical protein WCJ35_18735 [Planctomycetota bacterium]